MLSRQMSPANMAFMEREEAVENSTHNWAFFRNYHILKEICLLLICKNLRQGPGRSNWRVLRSVSIKKDFKSDHRLISGK
jgi:hypothetical protein